MSTSTTKELVDDVLAAMKKAVNNGDVDALNEKTFAEAQPKEDPAVAPATALTAGAKTVIRPNGEAYIIRKMGIHDDVQVMRTARDEKLPILLYGIPGCGKTALFEAAFADVGFEYVPGSGDTEVADFTGGYTPLPDGNFFWVDGPLIRAMEKGIPLLVDEIALIDPKVMALVYSIMDGRDELNVTSNPTRGIVKVQQGFAVFGACNPNAPGARMSEALLSRFQLHAEVGVDFNMVKGMGVPQKMITAAMNMKTKFDNQEIGWYPAIRELLAFKKISELLGLETALANMVSLAPEVERPGVADILIQTYGQEVKVLTIK
jgi:hypothetical protein